MADKVGNRTLGTMLEEAERKGRNEGMADMFALLSAANAGDQQKYFYDCQQDGEDPQYLQSCTNFALLLAAKQNHTELLVFFLEAGADVDSCDEQDGTALHIAVKKGHAEIIRELVKAGANPRLTNDDGETPLALALVTRQVEIVKALLAAGIDVNDGYQLGGGWLIDYEAEGDYVEMTQVVLEAGASIEPDDHKYSWETNFGNPLMAAAYHGKAKAAALLIKAGCDVNARDDNGETVLMNAVQGDNKGVLDTIRILLKFGAEINSKDNDGYTALLHAAAAACHLEAVRLLLSAGADVFSRAKAREGSYHTPARKGTSAFDVATDAVKEIIKNEMHRRIAAALSVLPLMPVDVRRKIIQLFIEN